MFAINYFDKWFAIDLPKSTFYLVSNPINLVPYEEVTLNGDSELTSDVSAILKKFNFLEFGGCKMVSNSGKSYLKKIFGIIDFTNKVQYGKHKNKYITIFRPLSFSSRTSSFLIKTKSKLNQNVYAFATYTPEKFNGFNILQCEEILGQVNLQSLDVISPFYSNNCYPNRWKKEIKNPEYSGLDLTEKNVFSIDGDTTKDVDDAIHFEVLDDKSVIGIHIADVANLYLNGGIIKENKEEFLEKIAENFSSIYPGQNGKIDMINKDVGENFCSLVEGQTRNVVSLLLNFSHQKPYKLIGAKIHLSKVINKYKLTYKFVDKMLNGSKKAHPLKEDFFRIKDILDNCEDLPHFMENNYEDETEQISRTIVAKLMTMYNTIMAKKLFDKNKNSILRIHKGTTGIITDCSNPVLTEIYQRMETFKGYYVVSSTVKDAEIEHKGLQLKYYTHMTSPIRRFPDFWNQICLHEMLNKCNGETKKINILRIISHINWKQMQIKKAYEQLDLVDIFHKKLQGDLAEILSGYIFKLQDDTVNVYLPTVGKKILRMKIKMDNLDNILDKVKEDENEMIWQRKDNGSQFILKKFMQIKCKLVVMKNKYQWNNKLTIELIEPSFSNFLLE